MNNFEIEWTAHTFWSHNVSDDSIWYIIGNFEVGFNRFGAIREHGKEKEENIFVWVL